MESYDVIIVGGGIAGCGLAYNLSKTCPEKSVLVIDKTEIGSNRGYGYRVVEEKIVKEYNLPYVKRFKGLKIGSHKKILATIPKEDYFVDYQEAAKHLFRKSNWLFTTSEAKSINKNTLITDKGSFKFKYLIDCSGSSFFIRKIRKDPLPFRYWLGLTRVLKGDTIEIDKNYYYYLFGEDGSFEDFYVLGNKIIQGYWQYTEKIDHSLIRIPKINFLSKHTKNIKITLEKKVIISSSPVFPLVYKNIALLGDSFGNAFTASAIGTTPILDSSKILTQAIKKDNLKHYEKEWKKKYFKSYLRFLVSRIDRYNNPPLFKLLKKKYPRNVDILKFFDKKPELFVKILRNEDDVNLSMISDQYPKYSKIFLLYYYIKLRLKYFLMGLL